VGDLEYTVVRVFSNVGGEIREVWRFINEGMVRGSEGVNTRSSLLSEEVFISSEGKEIKISKRRRPKLVLAFYYPWYGNPQGTSRRWFHWKGVTYGDIATATHFPLLGPYDSWDEDVIRSHIAMARVMGIDGFICSWWGMGTFEDSAFRRILRVAREEGFKVTIYYESVRDINKEQIVEELSYVLKEYSSDPAFLKIGEKPVIFIYAVKAKDRDLLFWSDVLNMVRKKTSIDTMYIGDTYDISFLSIFEGLHTYNPIWVKDHMKVYKEMSQNVKSYVPREATSIGKSARKLWCAGVVPGYDDRKVRKPGTYISREGGKYYERIWRAAIESEADIITICSWNEWHEGTEIEPGKELGFKYLIMTKRFIEEYKSIKLPRFPAPRIEVSIKKMKNAIKLLLANKGESPAVITHIYIKHEGGNAVVSSYYSLPINSTDLVVFIPYLGSGKELSIDILVTGVKKINIKGITWSPSGEETKLSIGSIEVEENGEEKRAH